MGGWITHSSPKVDLGLPSKEDRRALTLGLPLDLLLLLILPMIDEWRNYELLLWPEGLCVDLIQIQKVRKDSKVDVMTKTSCRTNSSLNSSDSFLLKPKVGNSHLFFFERKKERKRQRTTPRWVMEPKAHNGCMGVMLNCVHARKLCCQWYFLTIEFRRGIQSESA